MTPEAKVKAAVVKQLKAAGAYCFFPLTGGFGKSGVPDIVGSYRGLFFGIECKSGMNIPTALQERQLMAIEESGGAALVVREGNMDTVHEWLLNVHKEFEHNVMENRV